MRRPGRTLPARILLLLVTVTMIVSAGAKDKKVNAANYTEGIVQHFLL